MMTQEFEKLAGIDFGERKPKIVYFPWFSNRYLITADLCMIKDKKDLLTKWHELGHAYVNRLNPEILKRKFNFDPERYFVGKIVTEGVAEYMSIEAALKFGEQTRISAEQARKKHYFGNDEFLYKAAFVFSHEVGEVIKVAEKGKLAATKKLAEYLKNLEKSYYYLGYNFVDKMIKNGRSLEDIITNPPQNLEEIIQVFEKPNLLK